MPDEFDGSVENQIRTTQEECPSAFLSGQTLLGILANRDLWP
jgi:hypothetical protein